MINQTKRQQDIEQKEKIHRRVYAKVDPENYECIPPKKQVDYYDNDVAQRVAVYARVSTDNVQQTSSYELQKKYYEEFVIRHPNWSLVKIYADAAAIIGLNQKPEANGRRFSPFSLVSAHFKANGGCNCLI